MSNLSCKAKTKSGKSCKNPPMRNSAYCYIHSFGKNKNIPFYKNATYHLLTSIFLPFAIWLITLKVSPTKDNQDKILESTESIKKNQNIISENTEIIKDLLEEMRTTERYNNSDLLKRYTSGFIIFASTHTGLITPPQSRMLEDYYLDWSKVNIIFLQDSTISFLLPDVTYSPKNKNINIEYHGIIAKIPIGKPGSIYPFPIYSTPFPDNLYIEILSYTDQGVILCVGFRKRNINK